MLMKHFLRFKSTHLHQMRSAALTYPLSVCRSGCIAITIDYSLLDIYKQNLVPSTFDKFD